MTPQLHDRRDLEADAQPVAYPWFIRGEPIAWCITDAAIGLPGVWCVVEMAKVASAEPWPYALVPWTCLGVFAGAVYLTMLNCALLARINWFLLGRYVISQDEIRVFAGSQGSETRISLMAVTKIVRVRGMPSYRSNQLYAFLDLTDAWGQSVRLLADMADAERVLERCNPLATKREVYLWTWMGEQLKRKGS